MEEYLHLSNISQGSYRSNNEKGGNAVLRTLNDYSLSDLTQLKEVRSITFLFGIWALASLIKNKGYLAPLSLLFIETVVRSFVRPGFAKWSLKRQLNSSASTLLRTSSINSYQLITMMSAQISAKKLWCCITKY